MTKQRSFICRYRNTLWFVHEVIVLYSILDPQTYPPVCKDLFNLINSRLWRTTADFVRYIWYGAWVLGSTGTRYSYRDCLYYIQSDLLRRARQAGPVDGVILMMQSFMYNGSSHLIHAGI